MHAPLEPATAPVDADRGKASLRVWLRMMACGNRIEQELRTRLRKEFGLTLPQFDALAELEHAARPLTMSELSGELMLSNGNVTGVIERLIRDGWVQRAPSTADRRVHYVELTAAGLARFAHIAARHEAWVGELLAALTPKELDTLSGVFRRIETAIAAGAAARSV
jgi:DNA-binding MarR family transcriptional regulator